jgi:hypothetical protein
MFEIFLTLILAISVSFDLNIWLKVLAFVLWAILVLPGVYAMIFGAPCVRSLKRKDSAIFELGNFGAGDSVVDLGCGDGVLIGRIAEKNVSLAVGYELSIPTFLFAKILTFFCKGKAKIVYGNFWKKDLTKFNKIFCFLFDRPMEKFEKEIWPNLKKGTIVISNEFKMPNVRPKKVLDRVYLYEK